METTTVPALLPARMLNEFTYCPRLAYLEWVEGEFAHSADTLDGEYKHRRVNVPGGKLPTPVSGKTSTGSPAEDAKLETIHARSVHLSAPLEGLTAVLDLLEGEPSDPSEPGTLRVTPVDYKRGAVPDHLPDRAWEADRVQLCAQALILRENGYCCESGVLYYAESRTRIEIPIDDALCARTRELARSMRFIMNGEHAPAPLVDSPKCPRCSLVGICLPDETRLLAESRTGESTEAGDDRVRALLPARDDAHPLYVQEQGASVGKDGECLVVRMRADRNKSGPGAVLAEARLADVSQVSLYGNVQVSTQVVHTLLEAGVPIAYFSYGGWFNGMTLGLPSKNIELRRRQFLAAQNPTVCLELARTITAGKIENQRTLLRRNGAPDERTLEEMKRMAKRCDEAENIGALLGVEGNAARAYFSAFGSMLRPRGQGDEPGPFRFEFEKRNRRPPTDPVNALLSYAYSLLAKDLTVVCWAVGFDPYLGVYHQPRFGRPALALDMMEEFRPVIADSVVLTAINTGVVTGTDFLRRGPAVSLTPDGRKRFLQCYERRMDSLVTHPVFGYQISYRRVLDVQARLLARRLSGELPAYPAFTVR